MVTTTQKRGEIAQLVAQHAPRSGDSLNHKAAAAYLDRTPEWLRLQNKAGTAPPSVRVGRERRYLKTDLDAWLAKRHKAVHP